MNSLLKSISLCAVVAFTSACDKGLLPNIAFKTGGNYLSVDTTKAGKSSITMGINASKSESADVLKKFNISKSVNGAATTSLLDKDLTGAEGDTFSMDYTTTLDSIRGQKNKYIFTVTNRDGLVNQVSLTVTIQ
jgi:hypothetical protein